MDFFENLPMLPSSWREALAQLEGLSLPQNPVQDLMGSMLLAILSLGFLHWSTTRWTPRVLNEYGIRYHGWRQAWFPSWFGSWLWIALQGWFVKELAAGCPPLAIPCAAFMTAALYGALRLDLKFQLIPNRFQFVGLVGAVGYALIQAQDHGLLVAKNSALGLAVAGGLALLTTAYERWRHRPGMGMGDIKLLAWLGIALGPANALVLLWGILGATLVAVPLLMLGVRRLRNTFAFGPYLVAGCFLVLLL